MRGNMIYAVVAVMVCLIAPMATGFLWPVDSEVRTSWETNGENIDLTNDLNTYDIWGTTTNSDAKNNMFGRMGPSFWTGPTPNAYTTNDSAYEAYYTDYLSVWLTMSPGTYVMGPADIKQVFDDTKAELALQGKTNLGYIEINDSNPEPKMWTSDGHYELESYWYYPNGLAKGVIMSTVPDIGGSVVDLTGKDITLYVESGLNVTPMYYPVNAQGIRQYADVSQGFVIPQGETFTWLNGYTNHAIDIVIEVPDASNEVAPVEYYFAYLSYSLGVGVFIDTDNKITLHSVSSGDVDLGYRDAYPYVLLRIDSDNERIRLYGLIGYDGFTVPSTSNLGNMVERSITGIQPFRQIEFYNSLSSMDLKYMVTSALAESYTFKGISNATIRPSDYYADTFWLLKISNPAVFGSSLTFRGSDTVTYPITNGAVTMPLYEKGVIVNKTVSVRDMRITHVMDNGTSKVFINDAQYGGDNNLLTIGLDGKWVTGVVLYDVDAYDKTAYVWEGGGFGLDTLGFCAVGILSALGCFVLFGFIYRREGDWGPMLGMAVSMVCGALYMLIALQ